MSATEELRALLDARGVEWSSIGGDTAWFDSRGWTVEAVADDVDGTMLYVTALMTPTQAVEATLGRGTCHMTLRDDMRGHAYQDVYECSECGEQVVRETYMGESEQPKFCPSCGREVVE